MSELRQLIALREVAKLHVKQWESKAWAQSHGALFHEDPSCRPKCLEHANLYHGRMMEARFWLEQIQSAIEGEERIEHDLAWIDKAMPESTTVEKSTIVDKQAEATAAAVVLGEEQRSGTWFSCAYCGALYDQSEANARMRVCCGHGLRVNQGEATRWAKNSKGE